MCVCLFKGQSRLLLIVQRLKTILCLLGEPHWEVNLTSDVTVFLSSTPATQQNTHTKTTTECKHSFSSVFFFVGVEGVNRIKMSGCEGEDEEGERGMRDGPTLKKHSGRGEEGQT